MAADDVLGCDLSLASPAFALIDGEGRLLRYAQVDQAKRPRIEQASGIVEQLGLFMEHEPGAIAVESNAGIGNWHSSGGYGMLDALGFVRGVVWGALIAWQYAGAIREMPTRDIRRLVCANAYAGKGQVQENIRMRGYAIPDRDGVLLDGVYDALAVALAVRAVLQAEALGARVLPPKRPGRRRGPRGARKAAPRP